MMILRVVGGLIKIAGLFIFGIVGIVARGFSVARATAAVRVSRVMVAAARIRLVLARVARAAVVSRGVRAVISAVR